jgi:hypothetical protein
MKSLNPTYLFLMLFMLFATSCAEEEEPGIYDQLLGTWELTGKSIDEQPVTLSACEQLNTLEFQEYNLCILFDGCAGDSIFSGWNYTYDMLNIAALLPAGYYVEQIDESSLVISRKDLTGEGDLQETVLSYIRNH